MTGGRFLGWFQTPRGRVALALSAVVALWIAAWFLVVIGLVAPMSDFEREGDSGWRLARVAFAAATILFVTSGPLAYWIGRRRWLLALPVGLLVVWGVGVAVAAAT